ncbi:MAG: hypothetical protein HC886_11290 [Leptolyngbyaceae cyanobacterium SM1_1_3]|nr:hypothetical protein [Leptolyngbyaceae cyanobacterium SM1_1_3]
MWLAIAGAAAPIEFQGAELGIAGADAAGVNQQSAAKAETSNSSGSNNRPAGLRPLPKLFRAWRK